MNCMSKKRMRGTGLVLLAGIVLGIGGSAIWRPVIVPEFGSGSEQMMSFFPTMVREVHAALDEGDYEFFPNRRMMWVVNRTNGRMANYHFHDDEIGSVDRSRVATVDLKTFPRKDTVIHMSDRNLNHILWVCNVRTGDIQMWTLVRDGTLKGEAPVASSIDLLDRAPAKQK